MDTDLAQWADSVKNHPMRQDMSMSMGTDMALDEEALDWVTASPVFVFVLQKTPISTAFDPGGHLILL